MKYVKKNYKKWKKTWKNVPKNALKNPKKKFGTMIGTIIGIVKVTLSNNNHKWPTFRRFWRCRKYKMMCRYGQRLNQVHNQKRQFLFTKSTELIRRVSFTKQPSLINNKPVHFVFYRDIHTYARFYPKSYRRQGSTDQNCWLTGKVYVPVYDHGWKYMIILRDVYDLLKYTILRFWNYTIFLLKIYDHYFTPKWSYTLHPSDRIPR